MFSKVAPLVLLAAALGAHAQSDTSATALPSGIPSNITPCALNCIQQGLSAGGCTGLTDLNCLCTSQAFQQSAASCLTTSCTSDDLAAALALQSQECAAVSGGSSAPTGSPTSAPSSPASAQTSTPSGGASTTGSSHSTSGTTSGTSPSPTSPSPSPSQTSAASLGYSSQGSLAGFAVAAVGLIVGAGLIL